jgi:hypothetical protein
MWTVFLSVVRRRTREVARERTEAVAGESAGREFWRMKTRLVDTPE